MDLDLQQKAKKLVQDEVYSDMSEAFFYLFKVGDVPDVFKNLEYYRDYEGALLEAGWTTYEVLDGLFCFTNTNPSREEFKMANIFGGELYSLTVEPDGDPVPDPAFFSSYDELCTLEKWQALCYYESIDYIRREIYEYWKVSDKLAEKLEIFGESVARNSPEPAIWGRTDTGQEIWADDVIQRIAKSWK